MLTLNKFNNLMLVNEIDLRFAVITKVSTEFKIHIHLRDTVFE